MEIGERIKQRRKELKYSADFLAAKLNVSRSTIFRYENGDIEKVPITVISELAKILHISPSYLMGWEDKTTNNQNVQFYNYFDTSISAGLPSNVGAFYKTNTAEIELSDVVMGKYAGDKDIFVTRVNGESMNKIIPDNSLIAVKKITLDELKNNDIVVFKDGGDFSVKRFMYDVDNKKIIFRPDSTDDAFFDIVYAMNNTDDLQIIGKVIVYIVNDL